MLWQVAFVAFSPALKRLPFVITPTTLLAQGDPIVAGAGSQ
jgi:hypothetical protein